MTTVSGFPASEEIYADTDIIVQRAFNVVLEILILLNLTLRVSSEPQTDEGIFHAVAGHQLPESVRMDETVTYTQGEVDAMIANAVTQRSRFSCAFSYVSYSANSFPAYVSPIFEKSVVLKSARQNSSYNLPRKSPCAALYAAVAVGCCSVAMDVVLYGRDEAKLLYIISDRPERITQRLLEDLDVGTTYINRGIDRRDGQTDPEFPHAKDQNRNI